MEPHTTMVQAKRQFSVPVSSNGAVHDISDCFGSLDHEVMLSALSEKIHDRRFLRLLRNMLQAGYLEDWVWNATLSGAPQGGVLSPILSNIYLHRLDNFAEKILIPEYNRGAERVKNPAYRKV
jgi:retron-type reverse transcriptase